MKLIYIAGPYRPYTCSDGTWVGTSMNIRNAEVTAVNLVNELGHLGLFPVVPHLNTRDFENQVKQNNDQYFLDGTMAMLERCDAVLLTMQNADEVSSGTKAEVHRAHQLGIQVYRSFDALRRAAQENQIVRLPDARWTSAYVPVRKDNGPVSFPQFRTADGRVDADTLRSKFLEAYPDIKDAAESLFGMSYEQIEERAMASFLVGPSEIVHATELCPGDRISVKTKAGFSTRVVDVVLKQSPAEVSITWRDGLTEVFPDSQRFYRMRQSA